MVVDDHVDDRQAAGLLAGQVVGPLLLRSPVERFQDDAVGIGAIAGEAANDLVGATIAECHRRAGCDRDAAADNRVGTEMPGREVAYVHAAATTAAVALFLAEEFRDHAVDVLFESVGEEPVVVRRLGPGRTGSQIVRRHRPDRREALGDCVAVASVGARDVVVGAEGPAGTDGCGLLTDRYVGRAAVVVARQGIVSAGAEADDHLLQFADGQHVVQQVQGCGSGDASGRDLGAGVADEIKAVDGAQRLYEGREVRPCVALVCRLLDH